MNIVVGIAKVLLVLGGLNWGLVGLVNFNLVEAIFGIGSVATRVVYVIVGVAALIALLDFVPQNRSRQPQV
ncbi:uncharacterized membrane protein YuzA (DUF378 family) [Leucobacter luti]|uniref:DUF378 domain-containing protein n=1 Tax=Leucobacter luti TaxID=340320 RepID=UPI0010449A6F|nr:DUF378 domain-containing protein [Leucobacter luti]MCW2289115.1 uncharacterized membrane protein YuzA (DUF378 family) [Leucobacter luti]TCK35488.1 uncharacterized membrane protein YuzA (DUF378 family) [Leucobacter luti]